MKITFLGTGAADWPSEKNEKLTDFRRLSSLLIDDVLLIDPGPAVPAALGEFGKNPEKIRYIIIPTATATIIRRRLLTR